MDYSVGISKTAANHFVKLQFSQFFLILPDFLVNTIKKY